MRIYLVSADVTRRNTVRTITSPSCSRVAISSPLDRIVSDQMGRGILFMPKPMLFAPSTIQSSAERRWSLFASRHRASLIRSRVPRVSAFWKSVSGNTVSAVGCTVKLTESNPVFACALRHSQLTTWTTWFEIRCIMFYNIID